MTRKLGPIRWATIVFVGLALCVVAARWALVRDAPREIWLPSPPNAVTGTRARSAPDGDELGWRVDSIVIVDDDYLDAVCVEDVGPVHRLFRRLGLVGDETPVFYKPDAEDVVVRGRGWRRHVFHFR